MEDLFRQNEIIDRARDNLIALFEKNGDKFARDLQRIIGGGAFDLKSIEEALTQLGYDRAVIDGLGEFDSIFKLSEEMFKKTGVPFIWTAQNETVFNTFLQAKAQSLMQIQKGKFASDLYNYAVAVKLSNKPSKQVIGEMTERVAQEGRRIGTEVDTALATFDRVTKNELYKNAGVERFIYWGPVDAYNRESCASILSDPRQSTGWTRAEIDADPRVDFNLGGVPYYNCRHEWIPFLPETVEAQPIKEAE